MEKMDSEHVCGHHKVYSSTLPRAWICRFCGEQGQDRIEVMSAGGDEFDDLLARKTSGGFDGKGDL